MSGINVNFDVVNQKGTPAFYSDIFANRPSYGYPGRIFISTDTGAIYEDTGSDWTLIADAGAGTTGTLQQVTTNGNTTTQGISISAGGISSNSITNTSLTTGSVSFVGASGLMTQDNTNLFWDNTSKYLGIGPTSGPTAPLDIHNGSVNVLMQLNATSTNNSNIAFLNGGVGKWRVGNLYNAGANSFQVYDVLSATARLTILNSGATTLNGTLTTTGYLNASSLQVTGNASSYRELIYYTNTTPRWDVLTDNTAETGSDSGSNYQITRYSDGGTPLGSVFQINRATGNITDVFNITAQSFIKSGGTSSQFLKADGTVDSNTYLTTGSATSTYLPLAGGTLTGALSGTSITGTSLVKSGGTSAQILAGDGSVITAGTNITISGGTISASGGGSGVTSLSAIGSTANANGATITGSVLNLQPASASFGGVVTTGTQTFAGAKTFNTTLNASSNITTNASVGFLNIASGGTAPSSLSGYSQLYFDSYQLKIRKSDNQTISLRYPASALTQTWDLNVEGYITVQSTASLTTGSIMFVKSTGDLTQDNANFFWDNTNKRLGIGTSTPSYGLDFQSATASNALIQVTFTGYASVFLQAFNGNGYVGTSTNDAFNINTNNISRINITNAGVVKIVNLAGTGSRTVLADANGTLSAPVSDISVKQNIQNIGYGLNEILKMKPVWFNYNDEYKNYGKGRQNGNIAQEMETIIPEAVFTTPITGKMGINYDQLHAIYIKAIQELKAEIDALKNN